MKNKVKGSGATVTLDKNNFVAKGGEGSIHIIGDTVYKVCEPGKMIADGKFKELAVLDHKRIIRPEDVLLDSKDKPVGYTMRAVPNNPMPLARILTKTYRDREGITGDMMRALVEQIAEGIRFVHKHPGYLQVDGNELNYMVTSTYGEVFFIDVNSYQTPHFPADAIMPSIRDWNAGTNFTQLSDWYSFAIISFYMFTGIHPFKGRHPRFPNLKTAMVDQMKAGISVFDKDSSFPHAAVYYPFDAVIPPNYYDWYRKIFVDNRRLPPPGVVQSVAAFVFKPKEVIGTNNFEILMLREYNGTITSYIERNGREIVVTTDGLYVDNQPKPRFIVKHRVGFTQKSGTPVALVVENGVAQVANLERQVFLSSDSTGTAFQMQCHDIMSCEGRLYLHSGAHVYEVSFVEQGDTIIPVPKPVAQVMPHATKLHQGVAIQDMFGACIASIFPEAGHHRQVKLDEIVPPLRITEAKYEKNVLMVVAIDGETGQSHRFIFRFSPDWQKYDVRKIEDITPTGINFTVLDNGITVCIDEDEKVEIFSNKYGVPAIKSISDPAIKGDMRLCHAGPQVRFAHGSKLYSFAVRKP